MRSSVSPSAALGLITLEVSSPSDSDPWQKERQISSDFLGREWRLRALETVNSSDAYKLSAQIRSVVSAGTSQGGLCVKNWPSQYVSGHSKIYLQPRTTSKIVFQRCSRNTQAGFILSDANFFDVLKTTLAVAKMFMSKFDFRFIKATTEDNGANLRTFLFSKKQVWLYANGIFLWRRLSCDPLSVGVCPGWNSGQAWRFSPWLQDSCYVQ